jgi:ATP-dependent DNA helicase RecG
LDLQDIRSLVDQGEGPTVELKGTTAGLRDAMRTLCGFLNGRGGCVLFGVADDGRITGQMVSERTRQEPPPPYEVDFVAVTGKLHVVVLTVAGATPGVPYLQDGRPYERKMDKTTRMPSNVHERLLMARAVTSRSWEAEPDDNLSIEDLDEVEIARWRESAAERRRLEVPPDLPVPDLLARLGLSSRGKLTRAAVTLFARPARLVYPQCLLKLGRFRGTTVTGPVVDSRQERMNAFAMVREGMSFLLRNIPLSSVISNESALRQDRYLVPEPALREVLHNAVMHRDYLNPGGSVEVNVFDDRVEISSLGRLPPELTLEALLRPHRSIPRNPLIAEAFYRAGYVDRWGSGIDRILGACAEARLAAPRFEERNGFLLVTIPACWSDRAWSRRRDQAGTKSGPSRNQARRSS